MMKFPRSNEYELKNLDSKLSNSIRSINALVLSKIKESQIPLKNYIIAKKNNTPARLFGINCSESNSESFTDYDDTIDLDGELIENEDLNNEANGSYTSNRHERVKIRNAYKRWFILNDCYSIKVPPFTKINYSP